MTISRRCPQHADENLKKLLNATLQFLSPTKQRIRGNKKYETRKTKVELAC